MELLTIPQAAEIVALSDKTLRRAIESGVLHTQPKRHHNSKILISQEQLDAYLTSRQPVSNDVQVSMDDRITAMQAQIDALLQQVRELASLQRVVQELESTVLLLQSPGLSNHEKGTVNDAHETIPPPENEVTGHDQTVTKQPKTHGKKQQEPTFELADFSRKWQPIYECVARLDFYEANWKLAPYIRQDTNGNVYHVEYCDYRYTTNKRKITEEMREKGKELKNTLSDKALAAMQQAGWQELETTNAGKLLYKQPD